MIGWLGLQSADEDEVVDDDDEDSSFDDVVYAFVGFVLTTGVV